MEGASRNVQSSAPPGRSWRKGPVHGTPCKHCWGCHRPGSRGERPRCRVTLDRALGVPALSTWKPPRVQNGAQDRASRGVPHSLPGRCQPSRGAEGLGEGLASDAAPAVSARPVPGRGVSCRPSRRRLCPASPFPPGRGGERGSLTPSEPSGCQCPGGSPALKVTRKDREDARAGRSGRAWPTHASGQSPRLRPAASLVAGRLSRRGGRESPGRRGKAADGWAAAPRHPRPPGPSGPSPVAEWLL